MLILLTILFPDTSGMEVNTESIRDYVEEQLALGPRVPGSNSSLAFKSWIYDTVPDGWEIITQNFTYREVELRNYLITVNTSFIPEYIIAAHYVRP